MRDASSGALRKNVEVLESEQVSVFNRFNAEVTEPQVGIGCLGSYCSRGAESSLTIRIFGRRAISAVGRSRPH